MQLPSFHPLVVSLTTHLFCNGISDNGSFFTSITASGAGRMRSKKPWIPRNKLAKIFTVALDQFSPVRKTSVTDNFIDCPSRTNSLAALLVTAIGSSIKFSCFYLNAGFHNAFCQSRWLPCGRHKDMSCFNDDNRESDPRVPASVAEIVAAVQQIVVIFVWRMKPTCFCVLDIYWWCIYCLP